jgi:hypothetical protein
MLSNGIFVKNIPDKPNSQSLEIIACTKIAIPNKSRISLKKFQRAKKSVFMFIV